MATKLNKPVVRETNMVVDSRPVTVELRPDNTIAFKVKYSRSPVVISLDDVYRAAVNKANEPETPRAEFRPATKASGKWQPMEVDDQEDKEDSDASFNEHGEEVDDFGDSVEDGDEPCDSEDNEAETKTDAKSKQRRYL